MSCIIYIFILESSAVLAGQGNRCFPCPARFVYHKNAAKDQTAHKEHYPNVGKWLRDAVRRKRSEFLKNDDRIYFVLRYDNWLIHRTLSSSFWRNTTSCDFVSLLALLRLLTVPQIEQSFKRNRIWKGNGYKMKRDEFSVLSTGRVLWMNLKKFSTHSKFISLIFCHWQSYIVRNGEHFEMDL